MDIMVNLSKDHKVVEVYHYYSHMAQILIPHKLKEWMKMEKELEESLNTIYGDIISLLTKVYQQSMVKLNNDLVKGSDMLLKK